jgi:hypothetical protein
MGWKLFGVVVKVEMRALVTATGLGSPMIIQFHVNQAIQTVR